MKVQKMKNIYTQNYIYSEIFCWVWTVAHIDRGPGPWKRQDFDLFSVIKPVEIVASQLWSQSLTHLKILDRQGWVSG